MLSIVTKCECVSLINYTIFAKHQYVCPIRTHNIHYILESLCSEAHIQFRTNIFMFVTVFIYIRYNWPIKIRPHCNKGSHWTVFHNVVKIPYNAILCYKMLVGFIGQLYHIYTKRFAKHQYQYQYQHVCPIRTHNISYILESLCSEAHMQL